MKYCSECGSDVELRIPAGDNRERFVCTRCETIFYSNPRIVAGTVPLHQGKVLMCKRAIEPRKGYWTLPGGFMEHGESTEEAALRETREEACAEVTLDKLYSMISVTHIGQVHLFFLADLAKPEFACGEESLEVRLFDFADIPWDDIAFSTVEHTLRRYMDSSINNDEMQVFTIDRNQMKYIAPKAE